MTWVHFLKHKYEAFDMFISFKNMIKNQTRRRIKCLRSDRGGEFTSKEFVEYVRNMALEDNFQLLEHHKKLMLWKERT